MINNLNVTCVEMDTQKILGVKSAWKLREKMRQKLPRRQINVFHVEDGKDGLNELINFSEYIAISVPELRKVYPKKYQEYVVQLARYIKEKKPDIDIHLLGCTENKINERCRFCTSADSTAWLTVAIAGRVHNHNWHMIKKDVFERYRKIAEMYLKRVKNEPTPKNIEYVAKMSCSAYYWKHIYETYLGSQD